MVQYRNIYIYTLHIHFFNIPCCVCVFYHIKKPVSIKRKKHRHTRHRLFWMGEISRKISHINTQYSILPSRHQWLSERKRKKSRHSHLNTLGKLCIDGKASEFSCKIKFWYFAIKSNSNIREWNFASLYSKAIVYVIFQTVWTLIRTLSPMVIFWLCHYYHYVYVCTCGIYV